jgi:hypothetical protein
MERSRWFWVRIALVVAGCFLGFSITSLENIDSSNVDWTTCLLLFIFVPLGLLLIIGIQAINPLSAEVWRKPSWDINPFIFKEPLQFFHLGAYHFMAGGTIGCIMLFYRGKQAAPLAISLLSIGVGLWLGVKLCIFTFRKKMGK